nr:heparan-alpha-glucosaminide N-acetyltransferase domain-containing protein [uncultured Blautia sp.]
MENVKKRLLLLDGIRGFAIVNMVLFHFLYDVFVVCQLKTQWYLHPWVQLWQQMICWTFLLVSGCTWNMGKQRLKRGIILNLLGFAVTAATLLFLPEQVIWFGILNLIGCAYLLLIPFEKILKKIPPYLGMAGSFLFYFFFQNLERGYLGFGEHALINIPARFCEFRLLTVLGLPYPGFYSSDYFPVFPWIFLFIAGYYLSLLLSKHPQLRKKFYPSVPLLSKIGQKSLLIYLLHQPVCMAVCLCIVYLADIR